MNNKKLLHQKRNNTVISLQEDLINALREYFNLRIQLKLGRLKKVHLLKKVRRNIASIKSYLYTNRNV